MGRRLLALVAVLTLVLLAMVADRALLLASDTTVILKTVPVDPRSLFRGDYVILNYDVSSLVPADLEGDDSFERDETIFVTLTRDGRYGVATGLYHRPPAGGAAKTILLRGRVTTANPGRVRVDYGIDSYFLPEGQGKDIEKALRERTEDARVEVEVALSKSGRAAIKTLILDGGPVHRERIF